MKSAADVGAEGLPGLAQRWEMGGNADHHQPHSLKSHGARLCSLQCSVHREAAQAVREMKGQSPEVWVLVSAVAQPCPSGNVLWQPQNPTYTIKAKGEKVGPRWGGFQR